MKIYGTKRVLACDVLEVAKAHEHYRRNVRYLGKREGILESYTPEILKRSPRKKKFPKQKSLILLLSL